MIHMTRSLFAYDVNRLGAGNRDALYPLEQNRAVDLLAELNGNRPRPVRRRLLLPLCPDGDVDVGRV